MKAKFKNNKIFLSEITNFEEERKVFENITDILFSNENIENARILEGPSEDGFIAEYKGSQFSVFFDLNYGLDPIRCTDENADFLLDVVSEAIKRI